MGSDSGAATVSFTCHLCGYQPLQTIEGYEELYRVTSDCRPWSRGGKLCVCQSCGASQKLIDSAWQSGASQIYEAYSIYHQSGGVEQAVFAENSGQSTPRSALLLKSLSEHLPDTGRLMDVGCGNGAFLSRFTGRSPRWSLVGTELNEKHRSTVEAIEDVEGLYTDPVSAPGTFDVITMIHVIEHIVAPASFLSRLRQKLKPGGLLVMQAPDYSQNPFDLLIEDHCTHFSLPTLAALVERTGYEVRIATTDWVPRELTLVAAASKTEDASKVAVSSAEVGSLSANRVSWLKAVLNDARSVARSKNFGIFGTSIAATWLGAELADAVGFFVDEDPHRTGRTFMGRPVLPPRDIPNNSDVFIAMPGPLAKTISRRLSTLGVNFYVPPVLD